MTWASDGATGREGFVGQPRGSVEGTWALGLPTRYRVVVGQLDSIDPGEQKLRRRGRAVAERQLKEAGHERASGHLRPGFGPHSLKTSTPSGDWFGEVDVFGIFPHLDCPTSLDCYMATRTEKTWVPRELALVLSLLVLGTANGDIGHALAGGALHEFETSIATAVWWPHRFESLRPGFFACGHELPVLLRRACLERSPEREHCVFRSCLRKVPRSIPS